MKKLLIILPLTMILCFTVSCQDKEAMAELEQFRAQAKVEEQNEEIILQFFEELNKTNVDNFQDVYAPNLAFYYPSKSDPLSKEEFIELMKMYFKAIPDLNWDIQDVIAKGDKVIVRSIDTGTHEGDLLGIPATGKKIEIGEIVIYRLQDGKIVEERVENDSLGLFQQLGMELKPKEGER